MNHSASPIPSAKGFAEDLVGAAGVIIDQLSQTHHLGALENVAQPKRTRLDYVASICDELLKLKVGRPGLGLGSAYKERIGGKSMTGLALAQTWAICLNAGHLFGTFATERGLLFCLQNEPRIRSAILNAVPSFAHEWCIQILDERSPHRFFCALAAMRVARVIGDSSVATTALHALIKYPLRSEENAAQFERARWAYRRARQIAYNRVQAQLQVGSYIDESQLNLLAHHIRQSSSGLGFDPDADRQNKAIRVLDALDDFHAEDLFADKQSAKQVLAHLKEFKDWWRNSGHSDHTEAIERLFTRPPDWPTHRAPELSHYARLHLSSTGMDWLAEVVRWLDDDACWRRSNFYINPSHDIASNGFSCDLYCDGPFPPAAAAHVATLLAEQAAVAARADSLLASRVWRSLGRFMVAALKDTLRSGSVVLEPAAKRNGTMTYVVAGTSLNSAQGRLDNLIGDIDSDDRKRELSGLSHALRAIPSSKPTSPHMIALGPIKIVAEDGAIAAEIDGVWCAFVSDAVEWYLLEHKSGRQTGARRQLEDTLSLFSSNHQSIQEVDLINGRAAWARFRVPAVASSPAEQLSLGL